MPNYLTPTFLQSPGFTQSLTPGPSSVYTPPSEVTAAMMSAAQQASQINQGLLPSIQSSALSQALTVSNQINAANSAAFYRSLNNALPNWQGALQTQQQALGSTASMANELMTGQLPQDVQQAIVQARAELGISQGAFGEVNQYATARDIGQTSLSLMTQGAALQGQVSTMASQLLTNALGVQAPLADTATLFQNIQNPMLQNLLVPAGTAMAGVANAMQSNAEFAWGRSLSIFNAGQEAQALQSAQSAAAATQAALNPAPAWPYYGGGGSMYWS